MERTCEGRKRSSEKTGDGCGLLAHQGAMSEWVTPETYFYKNIYLYSALKYFIIFQATKRFISSE